MAAACALCSPGGLDAFSAPRTRPTYSMGECAACSAEMFSLRLHLNPALFAPQLNSSYMQFILRRFKSLHRVVVPERCMLKMT